MPDGRSILPPGTILDFGQEGGHYKIDGEPVGYGGSGILYPAVRVTKKDQAARADPAAREDPTAKEDQDAKKDPSAKKDQTASTRREGWVWEEDAMRVAVKECYPLVRGAALNRRENGEILGQGDPLYAHARGMLKKERAVTAQIYNKGFRLIPLWSLAEKERISFDGEHFEETGNLYGIMERLDEKGVSLGQVLRQKEEGRTSFRAYTAIALTGQVLCALKEVHENGYLHGDIQENNIFLKGGELERPEQGQVSLIDFGAARPLMADGATEAIADRSLYTTNGYTAPECFQGNDGTLRLTRAADIYSVGYLLLRMLTGKAMDPRALQLVVNGKFLYGRQAKRIGCPSSVLGALNKILKKALEPGPAARYQSAEEMLEEIHRIERALAPKNSAIAAVDYAVFISYCHEEKSMEAAEQIQRMIEGYKIPKSLRPDKGEKGQKRLGKVFRDREELSSSGDMEAHIKEALDHSTFLIVLLCPDTPGSVWVSREVELFLKSHSRDQVLTVVVEGDPKETLPELLRKDEKEGQDGMRLQPVEGLAADIRGADKKERRKKLKTEIYRLLAPMLGCGYDDLRQRQREYQLKKTIRTMTAALLFLSVIAGYIGWQAYQIHQHYWETMIQRSKYLAQTSAELLKKGDRMAAIAVAMEALPAGEEDRSKPYVGEAEAALNQALYSYRSMQSRAYFLSGDRLLSMDARSKGVEQISPGGKWLLAVDGMETVYLWDLGSGVCERRWDTAFWQERGLSGGIRYFRFLDEDTLLLLTDDAMAMVDIDRQEVELIRRLEQEGYSRVYACGSDEDGSLLAVYRDFYYGMEDRSLAVYCREDGEMVCSVPVGTEMKGWPSMDPGTPAIDQGGCHLAMPFGAAYGSVAKEGETLGALLLVDLEKGPYALLESQTIGYRQVCFLEDGDVAAFGYKAAVLNDNREVTVPGTVGCYDPGTGRRLWETEITCQRRSDQGSGLQNRTVRIDGEEREILLLWCGRDIWFFDAGTGRVLWQYSCEESLAGIWPRQDIYILGMADGSMSLLSIEEQDVISLGTNVERRTDRFLFDARSETACLVTLEDGGGRIALLKKLGDTEREEVALKGELIHLHACPEKDLYAVYTMDEEDRRQITFYGLSDHQEKASVQIEGALQESWWSKGDGTVFCYLEERIGGEWGKDRIAAYDVGTQTICWQVQPQEAIDSCTYFCAGEEEGLLVNHGKRIDQIDLADGTVKASIDPEEGGEDWGGCIDVKEVQISPSGRYILLVTRVWQKDKDEAADILRILDRQEGREIFLSDEMVWRERRSYKDILYMAQKKDLVGICDDGTDSLLLLDLEKRKIVQRIPFYATDRRQVAFMADDRWILLWGNDYRLKLWDLEEARMRTVYGQELYQVSMLFVEEGSPFIEIRGVDADHQRYAQGRINWDRMLFCWEAGGRVYPYAHILEGTYVPEADKVLSIGPQRKEIYWYAMHSLDDLLEKAREVLGDYTLDETARMQYLMEE